MCISSITDNVRLVDYPPTWITATSEPAMTTRPALAAVTLTTSPGPASSPAVARVCTWPEWPSTGPRLTRLLPAPLSSQINDRTAHL